MPNCYIMSQRAMHERPKGLDKDNTLFFPESGMTTHDLVHSGRPKDYHIITDSHFLVGLYSRHEVFIFDNKDNRWINPGLQTYGTSRELLLSELWGIESSIQMAVLNGNVTNCMGRKIKTD